MAVAVIALLVLGPGKLPGALRSVGQWIRKLRKLTNEVRHQSGIDDVLRAEGFEGGLNELRSVIRGGTSLPSRALAPRTRPEKPRFVADISREYPCEGPDIYDALPEDLFEESDEAEEVASTQANAQPTSIEEGHAGQSREVSEEQVPPAASPSAVAESEK